jgi:predicted nucleic acid-binding protein
LIVADASVIVPFLAQAAREPIIFQLVVSQDVVAAPALLDYEVMSALRRLTLTREISPEFALTALSDLARMRIYRHAIDPFVDRVWSLRQNLSIYDASYVALAERLGAAFYTRDKRLANAPGNSARIIVV